MSEKTNGTIKKKLLLVNHQNPSSSTYVKRRDAGSLMWDKRLSNYTFLRVEFPSEETTVIDISSAAGDCTAIQEIINTYFK